MEIFKNLFALKLLEKVKLKKYTEDVIDCDRGLGQ